MRVIDKRPGQRSKQLTAEVRTQTVDELISGVKALDDVAKANPTPENLRAYVAEHNFMWSLCLNGPRRHCDKLHTDGKEVFRTIGWG